MLYVRFLYRRRRFTSLAEINRALADCIERINDRKHSRFRISRRERFEQCERAALKPLPSEPFEVAEWKEATLHADCYVQIEAVYYSAPHIHRLVSVTPLCFNHDFPDCYRGPYRRCCGICEISR